MKYIILFLGVIQCLNMVAQTHTNKSSQYYASISEAYKARNFNLDSAYHMWDKIYKADVDKMKKDDLAYLFHIGSTLHRMKRDKNNALKMSQSALKLYSDQKDEFGVSTTYLEMGNMYMDEFSLDSAKFYYQLSLNTKRKFTNDNEGIGIVLSNLGTVEDYLGNYGKASQYYFESIEINDKIGNKAQLSDTYNNLSILQYNLGNIDEAIEYQNKAIDINTEINNPLSESMNHVCLSTFYLEKSDILKAEIHGKRAETLCLKLNNQQGLLYALSALGDVYLKQKNYTVALRYYDQFLSKIDAKGNEYMKAQVLHKKAKILLEKDNTKNAKSLLNEVLEIYKKNGTIKELKEINEDLAVIEKKQGNVQGAFMFLEQSIIFRDSLFKEEKLKQTLNLEIKYQSEQKEAANQKLLAEQFTKQATISAQKNYLIGGSLGLLLVSLLSFFLYKQKEKQQQLNKDISSQKDQIQLLNRELNHRVKNNLAFMTSLLEMQGRRTNSVEAKEVLAESESRLNALALVHSQLFKSENDVDINLKTYLNEVLGHLKNIFSVSGKQLNIQSELMDFQVNAEDAMRLGLIINESVTNSVKHAFHDVSNPTIIIKLSKNPDGKLVMNYKDNGPGIATILQKEGMSNSLGLKLISLLKKQLGDRYIVMV